MGSVKPPIVEQGRWVTLGSPNLKPIHQKIYKYGYNPNFHKITKTQRRRWIRNQASKQKEIQQGGSSSQAPSEKNTNVASSTQDDMDCEETVSVKEDKNIYVSRHIPTQSAKDSYQPRSEIVGPSLRPQYLRNEKKQIEKEENEQEKPYETTRVFIGKKPKKGNQVKSEKSVIKVVPETAKDELVEAKKIEAVDTNIETEEDYQEDEDNDGEEFALSIGAIRKEEHTQTENMQEDDQGQEININTVDCNMVYVLPREFMSLERLELEENEDREEAQGTIQKTQGATPVLLVTENERFEASKMVFEKPSKQMTQHLKPLYIKAHMNGRPMNKVLVDNGASINILPYKILSKLAKTEEDLTSLDMAVNGFTGEPTITKGIIPIQIKMGSKVNTATFFVVNTKSAYNALLGRDWIHSNWVVPSSLHQVSMFWKDNNSIEIVMADNNPFTVCNNVDAMLYNKNMSIVKFAGLNNRTTDSITVEHLLDEGETSTSSETPKTLLGKAKGSKIEKLNDD
jgi:hypothetical protein